MPLKGNKMKLKIALLPLLVITLLNFSCDTTNPPDDNLQPGRRDYVWTVDTLEIPYSLVRRMWASGPNDVWAIASAGNLDSTIFHYDGTKWNCDGIYRSIDPKSIFGFGPNHIWLGGGDGKIWRYDGNSWNEYTILNVVPGNGITFENIWGDSPNNVYAVGSYVDENQLNNKGILAHFDGSTWKLLDLKVNNSLTKIYKDSDGTYFIQGSRFGMIDTSKVFLYNGNSLSEIYSNMETDSYAANIELIGGKVVITFGRNLYTYSNNNFKLFYSVSNSFFYLGIWGTNLKDIFLYMKDGIAHYNGSDVQYLVQHNNFNYRCTGFIVQENTVFFPLYDLSNGKTYMYKGVLPNNN
jgi:hypothetical protein